MILPRQDFEALFAQYEKELRNQKKRLKTAPTDALQQEVELLTKQVKQMRFLNKFYLSTLTSGPREDLDALKPLLPRLRTLPLAWLWQIGIDLTRVSEGVQLFLLVKGAFTLEPGLLPGVFDVLAMRFYSFEATATGPTVDEALALAEQQITKKMKKHPSWK